MGDQVCEPTIRGLVALAQSARFVYVHGDDGKPAAIVLPVGGWWHSRLPELHEGDRPADQEAWRHDHVGLDGRVP